MTDLAHLFSPLTIGGKTIKNRILQSAHITGFVENGLPTDRHVKYYEARARGGVGLIVQEATVVSPDCQYHPEMFPQGYRPEITPWLRKITEAVHRHDAAIFLQLWHGGHVSTSMHTWRPGWSSSEVPNAAFGEVPVEMDGRMIRQAVQQFADLAQKAKEAGYDGVELNFCHGYLQQQFLSPFNNIRTDEYGGNLENRMRFGMEIIAAVRQVIGRDMVLGIRSAADEFIAGGFTLDDAKEFTARWARTGDVDYLNLTVATSKSGPYAVPPMMVPPRPFVYCAAEIRQVVDIPVCAGVRINDPVMANAIIENGEADMVAMARGLLCDPEFPNKAKAGRLDDIRQCIACNEGCWERFCHHEPITCMQNPEAGREGEFQITPADHPRKVMVIGGGCAGMKAAAVAKQRGHQVDLYEKSPELGGVILIPAKVPGRQELEQAVRYLKHEITSVGVPVHLNTEVTAEMIEAKKPDVVILASGGKTIRNPGADVVGPGQAIQVAAGTDIAAAEDVLEGKAETGQRVVIADYQNYMKGLITAEYLADQGKAVTLVVPFPIRMMTHNSYDIDIMTYAVQLRNLETKGVKRISEYEVKRAAPGKVWIQNVFTEEFEELDADTLVISYWRKADTALYDALKDRIDIRRIGDALSPRRVINAIYEGYKVATEI